MTQEKGLYPHTSSHYNARVSLTRRTGIACQAFVHACMQFTRVAQLVILFLSFALREISEAH